MSPQECETAADSVDINVRALVSEPDMPLRGTQDPLHAHRLIQAKFARKYRSFVAERTLVATLQIAGRSLTLRGRLDGFRRTKNGAVVYEIKPVPGKAKDWLRHPALQPARRQLLIYSGLASLAFASTPKARIQAELVLVGADDSVAVEKIDTSDAIEKTVARLTREIVKPAGSNQEIEFAGLEKFIEGDLTSDRPLQSTAWRELSKFDRRVLLALRPGGGKTRLALRYALLRHAETEQPVLWITMKSRGRDEVLAEAGRYVSAGLPLTIAWKTSCERRCSCDSRDGACPIRLATEESIFWDGLSAQARIEASAPRSLDDYASRNALCPHVLSADLERDADLIIADFNYLLFGGPLTRRDFIVVVDETHNVLMRVQEHTQLYVSSAELRAGAAGLARPARTEFSDLLDHGPRLAVMFFATHCPDAFPRQTSREMSSPQFKLQRMAEFCRRYGRDFEVRFGHDSGSPFLAGRLVRAGSAVEALLPETSDVLALCGSLPADSAARSTLIPCYREFHVIEDAASGQLPGKVFIIPRLKFKFPLTLEDHIGAVELCRQLRDSIPGAHLVFGQNRESNRVMARRFRSLGFSVLLDEDLTSDWEDVSAVRPDYLFTVLGSNLSESVNPPEGLFSCCVVCSPGYRSQSEWERQWNSQSGHEENGGQELDFRCIESASRVIQAVGRVQRSPQTSAVAVLLNEDFASDAFMRLWPRHWYNRSARDLLLETVTDLQHRTAVDA